MVESAFRGLVKRDILLDILYVFGVIGLKQFKHPFFHVCNFSSIILIWITLAYSCVLYINVLRNNTDFNRAKVVVSFLIWRSLIVSNWFSLFLKRKHLMSLLLELNKQESMHKLRIGRRRLFKSIMTLTFLSLSLFITSKIATIVWMDPVLTERWFHLLSFGYKGTFSKVFKVAIVVVFFAIAKMFVVALPLLMTLFYTHFCSDLTRIIKKCNGLLDYLSRLKTKKCLMTFIKDYSRLHYLATLSESALSTQVFWLVASHFVMVFIQFSKLFQFHPYSASIYIENSIYPFFLTVSFFAIVYFASEIHREDGVLRANAEDLAFRLWLSKGTQKRGALLRQFIRSKQSIVFTASGMFHFHRSILLSCLAILLSYNLLILQLNHGSYK